jgi:hypothetical protein
MSYDHIISRNFTCKHTLCGGVDFAAKYPALRPPPPLQVDGWSHHQSVNARNDDTIIMEFSIFQNKSRIPRYYCELQSEILFRILENSVAEVIKKSEMNTGILLEFSCFYDLKKL